MQRLSWPVGEPCCAGQRARLSNCTTTWAWLGMAGIVTRSDVPTRVKLGAGAGAEPGGQTAGPVGVGPGAAWQVAVASEGISASGWLTLSATLVAASGPLFDTVTVKCSRSNDM